MVLRRVAAVATLLALLVAGVAMPATASAWIRTTVTLTYGGLTRSYLVVRPAGTDSVSSSGGISTRSRHTRVSLPVVVELHGCCTTPAYELERSGFETATGAAAILVYPAGYDGYWNAGACCGGAKADDVSFVAAVVRRVLASYPQADPSSVYLVGYSNGGRMAYRMACERPALFAAVAVFGAVNADACPSQSPIPILIAAGTDDPELTFAADGIPHVIHGYQEPTVTRQAESYALADGCAGSGVTSVDTTVWSGCSSGDPVVLMRYPGAGHGWPPGFASVVWRFCSAAGAPGRSAAASRAG